MSYPLKEGEIILTRRLELFKRINNNKEKSIYSLSKNLYDYTFTWKICNDLEKAGWVISANRGNKRVIKISPKGRKYLKELIKIENLLKK